MEFVLIKRLARITAFLSLIALPATARADGLVLDGLFVSFATTADGRLGMALTEVFP